MWPSALRTGQGVVVLGVVVGAVVDGTVVVVDGVGDPAFPDRGIGGEDDCGTGACSFPTAPTSALGCGVGADVGPFAVDDAGADGAPWAGTGCVGFGRVLDAPSEPRVSAVMPANPRANARTQAPTSAMRRVRDRPPGSSPPTWPRASPSAAGGVCSSGLNASRTAVAAGETGTGPAFRNPCVAKRGSLSGRRRSRAVAWSSWSGP